MIGISRIIANTTETEQIKDVKESFNLPSGYFDNYYQFQNYFSLLEEISAWYFYKKFQPDKQIREEILRGQGCMPLKESKKWEQVQRQEPLEVYYRSPLFELLKYSDGEGNGTLLQYSCLENPMDGGAWWAAVF